MAEIEGVTKLAPVPIAVPPDEPANQFIVPPKVVFALNKADNVTEPVSHRAAV